MAGADPAAGWTAWSVDGIGGTCLIIAAMTASLLAALGFDATVALWLRTTPLPEDGSWDPHATAVVRLGEARIACDPVAPAGTYRLGDGEHAHGRYCTTSVHVEGDHLTRTSSGVLSTTPYYYRLVTPSVAPAAWPAVCAAAASTTLSRRGSVHLRRFGPEHAEVVRWAPGASTGVRTVAAPDGTHTSHEVSVHDELLWFGVRAGAAARLLADLATG